jgi:hypothetical protein
VLGIGLLSLHQIQHSNTHYSSMLHTLDASYPEILLLEEHEHTHIRAAHGAESDTHGHWHWHWHTLVVTFATSTKPTHDASPRHDSFEPGRPFVSPSRSQWQLHFSISLQ